MAKRVRIPNFRSWRAVILHRPHPAADAVLRQLDRLGIEARIVWPELAPEDAGADVVLFDGDMCHDGQFPWAPGAAPMPLIALVASEAPGRLEWMLAQGITAHLLKPIASGGVFSSLVLACHGFERRRALEREAEDLRARLRRRPVVVRALGLMTERGLDADEALRELRTAAMARRQTLEDYCEALLAGGGGRRNGTGGA